MTTEPTQPAAPYTPDDASPASSPMMTRRGALLASAALLLTTQTARAEILPGGSGLPWRPFAGDAPAADEPGSRVFFTAAEGAVVEALVDRLVPPDAETPGGKDCGCAVFIDRQLAGPYGKADGLYMSGPFPSPMPGQRTLEPGLQHGYTPAELYRRSLAALESHCRGAYDGKSFATLAADTQDQLIAGMENGSLKLKGTDAAIFFALLLQNTREGFFADPVYGGNRDMAGWKMIGFPGARYDYRDWVERHNERYPHPPISIAARI
jgi:gluconate 2-dehydrogenase gamma chain